MTNPHAEDVDVRDRAEPVRSGPKHRAPTEGMSDRRLFAWLAFIVIMTALVMGTILEATTSS